MPKALDVEAYAFENGLQDPEASQNAIEHGGRACVADPYFMLGRQWALSEFLSSNGGSPVSIAFSYETLDLAGDSTSMEEKERLLPLKARVEARDATLDRAAAGALESGAPEDALLDAEIGKESLRAPDGAWIRPRLAYQVLLSAGGAPAPGVVSQVSVDPVRLAARRHYGGVLDWHAFHLERPKAGEPVGSATWRKHAAVTALPTLVTFQGMPRSRFWEFEDERVNFASSQLGGNVLGVMMQEFGLLYANDWFIVPIEQDVNTLRRIAGVTIRDVFDRAPDALPIISTSPSAFQLFALTQGPGEGTLANPDGPADSRYHLLLDALTSFHTGDPVEKVIFYRDESVNVVWGVEHVARGHEMPGDDASEDPPPVEPEPAAGERVRRYVPLRLPPRNYVPFKPVQMSGDGQVKLRRARTVVGAPGNPYQTVLVKDAIYVYEEEIPRQAVALTQNAHLACVETRNEGQSPLAYFLWVGRRKVASPPMPGGRMRFDQLEELGPDAARRNP